VVDGVIFDMDGLMFDTERLWYEAWEPVLARYGYAFDPQIAHDARGRAGKLLDEAIARNLGDDAPAHEIWLALADYAHDLIRERLEKKPGLDGILAYLQKEGIPAAIASSSPREMIDEDVDQTGVRPYFSAIVSAADFERPKPYPDAFLAAAEKIGARPERSVVLEDSFAGVAAGAAGGFITIMVPDLEQPTDEVRSQCYAVCADLNEAREVIAGL